MEYKEALDRAARLCSSQEYCISDITRKLESWGLDPGNIKKASNWLIKEKFIDEERYATYFVRDKFRLNKWGKLKIRYALRQKQIPPEHTETALATIPDDEYRDACLDLLRQKEKTLKNEHYLKKKAKLAAFATQRGYEQGLVFELIGILTGH
ncbi:MAG: regulatory protein RecX [Bacteroidota bacterium]